MAATLFLNIHFWVRHADDLSMHYPLLTHAGIVAGAALLISVLFFFGPALAVQKAKRSVFEVIEGSVGTIPALILRACSVIFLVIWMAEMTAVPLLWWIGSILRREAAWTESVLAAAAILAFVFITASQSATTNAKLALFTTKLGAAVLLAALIRVHEGWRRP